MSLAPGTILNGYIIRTFLGRGRMGEVYLAEDRHLHRDLALRILPADLVATPAGRAQVEGDAKTIAALDHVNIARVYEFGEADGYAFLAMEYVDGISLEERRTTDDPLSIGEIVGITMQVVAALQEAHEKQIVHGRLRSANILLAWGGRVKVLDFGLPGSLSSSAEADLVAFGSILGELLTARSAVTAGAAWPAAGAHGAPQPFSPAPPSDEAQARDALGALAAHLREGHLAGCSLADTSSHLRQIRDLLVSTPRQSRVH